SPPGASIEQRSSCFDSDRYLAILKVNVGAPGHERSKSAGELRRLGRQYRLLLCEQQYGCRFRVAPSDQRSLCRLDPRRPRSRGAARAAKARRATEAFRDAGAHRLPGRRKEVQVAAPPSEEPVRSFARTISRKMGIAAGLSDGRAELCGDPFGACEEDGSRPAAHTPELVFPRSSRGWARSVSVDTRL